MVRVAAFAAMVAVFNKLLGIIPCAARVRHEDRHHYAGNQRAGQKSTQGRRP